MGDSNRMLKLESCQQLNRLNSNFIRGIFDFQGYLNAEEQARPWPSLVACAIFLKS